MSVLTSRLAVGRALDTMDPRRTAAVALTLAAVGMATVCLAPIRAELQLEVGVFLIGFSIGSELDLLSFFCARCFGLISFSAIYGALSSFLYIGIALGGVGYGLTYDLTGSYGVALVISVLLLLVSAVLFLILPASPLARPASGATEIPI